MKRFLWALLALLVFLLSVNPRTVLMQSQTTVTGSIQTPTGVPATSGYIEFRLRPNSSTIAYRVQGTAAIAPQTSRCKINASGQVVGPTGTGACSVWGNTTLLPGNTCYDIAIAPGNVQANLVQSQLITGTTYDLSSPVFCPQVTLVPQFQSITTSPISANIIPAADKVFNLGDSQHYYGSAYIDQLFNNSLNITNFNPKKVNQVRKCDQFSGATASAKIIACIADLPATGGTADARGLEGTQSITAIIEVAKPVRLMLGAATYISTLLAGNNSIILLGSAGASVECAGPGHTQIIAATDTNGISITSSPASVKNCTLTGPDVGASVHQGINGGIGDVEISGNIIEKWGNGLNTGAGSNPGLYWKIHDNTVRLNNADGIFIPSDNNTIAHNQVYSNKSNGIDLNGSWNSVQGNVLFNNGTAHSGTDCWGILLAAVPGLNSNHNTVTGNTVDKSTCQGIILKPTTSQTVNYNTVDGNVVTNSQAANGDGIAIDGSSAGTIRGNVITGNTVKGNARHGILIDGSTGTAQENRIGNNIVEINVGTGLLVTGATALDNVVAHNTALGNTAAQYSVAGSTRTSFVGNKVSIADGGYYTSSTRVGIGIDSGAYGMLDVRSGATGTDGLFWGGTTNGWVWTEDGGGKANLKPTSTGTPGGSVVTVDTSGNVVIPVGGIQVGSTGVNLLDYWSSTASLTFNGGTNFSANTCYDNGGLTVTNAAVGDAVALGIPATFMNAGLSVTGWVSATNTVSVRVCNPTAGTVTNAGALTFRASVWHQ